MKWTEFEWENQMPAFAAGIAASQSLLNVHVSQNLLGPEGGKALASALQTNTSITTVGVSGNQLGPEGGKAIADALQTNVALQSIEIGSNDNPAICRTTECSECSSG